jgi:hypothetical protein
MAPLQDQLVDLRIRQLCFAVPDSRTAKLLSPESLFNAIQRRAELEEIVGIKTLGRPDGF